MSAGSPATLETLARLASPLAAELLLIEVVAEESELAASSVRLAELRSALGPGAERRPSSPAPGAASSRGWRLPTTSASSPWTYGAANDAARRSGRLLEQSPADVALLASRGAPPGGGDVLVGFGGSDHDWAAAELGAWLAASTRKPLKLVALRHPEAPAPPGCSRPRRSRSRARWASTRNPLLVDPGADGLLAAARERPCPRARAVSGVAKARAGRGQERVGAGGRDTAAARAPRPAAGRSGTPGAKTRFTWSLG